MSASKRTNPRLALLDELNLSQADRDLVVPELEELDRIVAELEAFAQDTPWVSAQIQPRGTKA